MLSQKSFSTSLVQELQYKTTRWVVSPCLWEVSPTFVLATAVARLWTGWLAFPFPRQVFQVVHRTTLIYTRLGFTELIWRWQVCQTDHSVGFNHQMLYSDNLHSLHQFNWPASQFMKLKLFTATSLICVCIMPHETEIFTAISLTCVCIMPHQTEIFTAISLTCVMSHQTETYIGGGNFWTISYPVDFQLCMCYTIWTYSWNTPRNLLSYNYFSPIPCPFKNLNVGIIIS